MLDISQKILSDHQVRKTKKQKLAFIEFMRGYYPDLKVEEGGFGHNRNIVVGDVKNAKVIMGAHYDTCAALPFPNLIMPKNILFTLLYSMLIVVPFLLAGGLAGGIMNYLTDSFLISYWTFFAVFMCSMIVVMFLGVPNKHTANDNTSGIVTLCELMATLGEAEREQVAFIFFDNEENGLLGSAFFYQMHKKEMKDKLLINFDCVSDGDHFLLVSNKSAEKKYGNALQASFSDTERINVHLSKSSTTFYPSDQMNFPNNIGVAFLNRNRIVGLYMNKIHTKKDTVFNEGNIEYICEGMKTLMGAILADSEN